jgi:hypothetical protein
MDIIHSRKILTCVISWCSSCSYRLLRCSRNPEPSLNVGNIYRQTDLHILARYGQSILDNAAREFRIYHIAMNCLIPLTMHWNHNQCDGDARFSCAVSVPNLVNYKQSGSVCLVTGSKDSAYILFQLAEMFSIEWKLIKVIANKQLRRSTLEHTTTR